jgi:three-Cys-motif partner protein
LEDTSFGIALNALRRAKASWKERRNVQMSAFLVERDATAYQQLAMVPTRYPDITVKTYNTDFLTVLPRILKEIPTDAFGFFFIDPKGWKIRLRDLRTLLARRSSEVIFNFMFEFINRAANISDPQVVTGLDELIPIGDWRQKLERLEQQYPDAVKLTERKAVLVESFGESLRQLGGYEYVAETTVLRPLKNRPLYCLFYATRNPKGIEVFRDSQFEALAAESAARAATKLKHTALSSGQGEMFESLHDMAPDTLKSFLENERLAAQDTLLEIVPAAPNFIPYVKAWAQVLARHIVRRPDVNSIAARLYREKRLAFPEWEKGKRVPQDRYRTQRI